MIKKNIDLLVLIAESFDSEILIRDFIKYKKNSIIMQYNFNSYGIYYCPKNIDIDKHKHKLLKFTNAFLENLLCPLTVIVNCIRIFLNLLKICLKYKVKIIYIDYCYVAALSSIIKKLRLVDIFLYRTGDWLAGQKLQKRIWTNINSSIIFPISDYIACRSSDIVLNITAEIGQERYRFWKRKITKKELVFKNRLQIKLKPQQLKKIRRKIVFMGWPRYDSGLEILFESIKKIKETFDISLVIFGNDTDKDKRLIKLIKKYNINKDVEVLGFIERKKIKDVFANCFCGVNLITSKNSFTTKTLPSKVYDYLQYLVPTIVTKNIGATAQIILKNKLGLVIQPKKEEFIAAVLNIFQYQNEYTNNIVKYVNSFKSSNIKDFMEF